VLLNLRCKEFYKVVIFLVPHLRRLTSSYYLPTLTASRSLASG